MNKIHVFINSQVLLTLCCLFAMIICTGHLANPHTSYAGEIYRWVDENGEVHYSDTDPGDSSSKGKKTKSIYIDDDPAVEKESKASPQEQKKSDTLKAASSKEVTIYTLDTWPYCHQAKAFLSQKGVSYKEIEVSRDREGASEMVRISGQRGVPVIVIDGDVIIGFNRRALEDKLR